jgi:hypothetical protein
MTQEMSMVAPWEVLTKIWERPPSTQETSTVAPWEVLTVIRERPPSTQETSTVGPLGGADGDLRVPTINVRNVNDGPPGRC